MREHSKLTISQTMKQFLTGAFALAATLPLTAQTAHTITQGEGYANDVFFSLENGIVAEEPSANWDIAFEVTGPFSAGVRVNDGNGLELAVFPGGDIASWADVDTLGFSEWARLNNGLDLWENGAFNVSPTGDPSDFSWGTYTGPPLHQVVGDSIFIVSSPEGSALKLRIDNLDNGTWNFTHAAIDGSDETSVAIDMADYAGKNFVYYSFAEGVVDREPAAADWDFVFTRYVGPTIYGLFPTTGVLLNRDRAAAVAEAIPVEEATFVPADLQFENISAIGNDWKELVDFQWQVAPDLSYFVQTADGGVYQIWFSSFEGSATGVTVMNAQPVSGASVESITSSFAAFPNPIAQGTLRLNGAEGMWEVRDITGRCMATFQARQGVAVDGWPAGTYFARPVDASSGAVRFMKQ